MLALLAVLAVMPVPAEFHSGPNALAVGPDFRVSVQNCSDAVVDRAVARMLGRLRAKTGLPLQSGAGAGLSVQCGGHDPKFGLPGMDESYRLEVRVEGAKLEANGETGILRGLVTFAQMVERQGAGFRLPEATIVDRPRFGWRGVSVDVARHPMELDVLLRNLDAMEWAKLNVLHLHLTDAEAFRMESKVYPKLHQSGSGGFFYTQEQMRRLVAEARDRGIRVVPEFDVPGHSKSWFFGYPELGSRAGTYKEGDDADVRNSALNPASEKAYEFLDRLFTEMMAIFPDPYFHIGADEVNGVQWQQNAAIKTFMKEHGLADRHAMLGYFTRRVFEIVKKHGRTAIGWDEVLAGDPPAGMAIQTWRSSKLVQVAASRGLPVIVSTGYYLDFALPASAHYSKDPDDPAAYGMDAKSWSRLEGKALATYFPRDTIVTPGAKMTDVEKSRILGGEAAIWSELVTSEMLEGWIWPRTAAVAERLWSPESVTDLTSMYERLIQFDHELETIGLRHHQNQAAMLRRAHGDARFAEAIEPTQYYTRIVGRRKNPPVSGARVVDALPPESLGAVEFRLNVRRALAGDAAAEDRVRKRLEVWRDLREKLAGPAEVLPAAEDLRILAAAGLRALDARKRGEPAQPVSSEIQAVFDRQARYAAGSTDMVSSFFSTVFPPGEVLIAILPAVEELLKANGKR